MANYFNQRPAESSLAMYKLLLVVLLSPHLQLEDFKTLISELTEVLPCIIRQEEILLKSPTFTGISSVKVPTVSDFDRKQFTAAFVEKIRRQDPST